MSSNGGYASVCEAFGGFRYVNGQNDPQTGLPSGGEHQCLSLVHVRPYHSLDSVGFCTAPVRPNISLGDSLAGLHAAFGTVLALLARGKAKSSGTRTGQT